MHLQIIRFSLVDHQSLTFFHSSAGPQSGWQLTALNFRIDFFKSQWLTNYQQSICVSIELVITDGMGDTAEVVRSSFGELKRLMCNWRVNWGKQFSPFPSFIDSFNCMRPFSRVIIREIKLLFPENVVLVLTSAIAAFSLAKEMKMFSNSVL